MQRYQKILLAVDLYENYDDLVKEAQRLQTAYQATLKVVYVTPHIVSSLPYAYNFQDSIRTQAEKRLQALQAKFGFSEDALFLREGNPKEEITDLARELQADLIISGSHGKHGFELILGSTANGILHLASCDVLTLRINDEGKHLGDFSYKNIVLAADLQEDNLPVIRRAQALQEQYQAKLHIIHVVGDVASLGYYPPIEIDLKGEAEKNLAELIQNQHLNVNADQVHVKIGFPREEILGLAQHVHADLIIIGSHGHKAIASALLGSTTNAVLHGANCDVLVVRI